jgi:hypothetical protein
MKTKVILLTFIFMLSFLSISCNKDRNPFTPAADVEEQTANTANTGSVASTGSQTKDFQSVKDEEKGSYHGPKSDVKGKSRTSHVASNGQVGEASTGNEVSNVTTNSVTASHNPKLKPKPRDHENNDETTQELRVRIQPFKWNINWANSMGLVTVRISGERFEEINPETLRLVGPEGAETGAPSKAQVGPFSFVAKFLKSEAIGIIPEPQRGVPYEIQVIGQFNDGTEFGPLIPNTNIFIVGKKSLAGILSLVIRPKKWNIAWGNGDDSESVVTARISGERFKDINPDSVEMDYPDGGLDPIPPIPLSYEFGGVSFVIKFTQSDAISLIPDPKRGDPYEIHVRGSLTDTTPFDLTFWITISGKKSGKGPLTLVIKPKKWNMTWADDGDGEVTARIKGENFDDIDAETVRMVGPGGASLEASSTEVGGFSFIAKFRQSAAFGLIPTPQPGTLYTIHVIGILDDGVTPFDCDDSITVKGKNK